MSLHRLFSEYEYHWSEAETPRFEIQLIDKKHGADTCTVEELYQAFKERLLEEMKK